MTALLTVGSIRHSSFFWLLVVRNCLQNIYTESVKWESLMKTTPEFKASAQSVLEERTAASRGRSCGGLNEISALPARCQSEENCL